MKTVDNVRVDDVRYGQLESENRVAKMLRSTTLAIFTFIVLDVVDASRASSSEEKESTRWLIKYNTSQLLNQLIGSTISINV